MRSYDKKPQKESHAMQPNPEKAGKQAPIHEFLQAYKTGNWNTQPMQRESIEEEELSHDQPSRNTVMLKIMERNDRILQQYAPEKKNDPIQHKSAPVQQQEAPNNTGLPDELKAGIENLSGYSMDDVQVHYNSDKPTQLNALAYAQGTDIHVGPGQEKHLPHEAWHVVQQKQGRVQPTMQMQGENINNDEKLEKEADKMGEKSLQRTTEHLNSIKPKRESLGKMNNLQRVVIQLADWYTYGSANTTPHVHCYNGGGHLQIRDRGRVRRYNIVQGGVLHPQHATALQLAAGNPRLLQAIQDLINTATTQSTEQTAESTHPSDDSSDDYDFPDMASMWKTIGRNFKKGEK